MVTNPREVLLLSALILHFLTNFAGAARPQLAWHASGGTIGLKADAQQGTKFLNYCGEHPDEICNLPGLNGVPHVRMRAGYITVSEVSNRQLWYLVADREEESSDLKHTGPEGPDGTSSSSSSNVNGDLSGATAGDAGYDRPQPGSGVAPVILWLTGGPGCSSLDAFIYEHGPFKFSYAAPTATTANGRNAEAEKEAEEAGGGGNAGDGLDKLSRQLRQRQRAVLLEPNPHSWTKVATIIYVDSPAGTGMSYSGRPEVDYHTNDEYTISDLVAFLRGLTERYSELATAPFFLAGESYGGVFVPLLARELLRVNRKRRADGEEPLVNLQGYSVGNPVTDDVVDGNAQLFFAADMGYIDPPSWRRMRAACDDMFWNATRDTECWDAQGVVKDDLWDLNWYDVLDPCTKPDDDNDAVTSSDVAKSGNSNGGGDRRQRQRQRPLQASELERLFYWPFSARMGYPPLQGSASPVEDQASRTEAAGGDRSGGRQLWGPWLRHVVPCMDRRIALDWLNRVEVRAALRAAPFSVIGEWQPCSDVLYYRLDTMNLVPVHEDLVRQGLRALVYSGDHDMVVPHTGTRKWVYDKADLGSTDGPLRPWMLHGQIAGFTARFSAGGGFRFATVKGAGHMVPQSKPLQALHLLKTFIYDEEL
ncbi:hypothetical protein Vafri_16287 [Volvox africanus]|uniref:Carboxypeptidase n=1 Tax=Volvox africanus TaxID=51714 RepID=A0A8J4BJF5_9CHLO|nr:hypothetical protein Vafri_16287 [Volvox africanus]